MAQFATILSGKIAQGLGVNLATDSSAKRPRVRDATRLIGKYDFILEFSCEGCVGPGNIAMLPGLVEPPQAETLPSIFAAVEKQLGLKLVKVADIPLDVIVVERVDRIPTSN